LVVAALVVVGLLIVLAVGRVFGDGPERTSQPQATAAPTTSPSPSESRTTEPPTTAKATTTKPIPSTTANARPALHPAHAWIKRNYPGVSWVPAITAIEERGRVLWAETKLAPGDPRGASICSALSAYQITETDEGFTGVTVRAADGQRLAWRMSLSEKC
jgi:hypothetical protein